jgi:glycosyltransferase involved in cell wall biosynthesis
VGDRPRRQAHESRNDHDGDRLHLVLGVTTYNRRKYLQRFIESFIETRDPDFIWTLVVADDGSTDSTYRYLDELSIPDCQLVVVRNKRATVTGQTNSIFEVATAVDYDYGFKADDDIYFSAPGWDSLYVDAMRSTGYQHLVFHSSDWAPAVHDVTDGPLHSSVPADRTMGCFWTFTPDVVDTIGVFDEANFRLRGHAHWDFTLRACRAGFNDADHAWDAAGSASHISLWGGEDYIGTVDWRAPEVASTLNARERNRRDALIRNDARRHVDPVFSSLGGRPPAVSLVPYDVPLARDLSERGFNVLDRGLRGGFERAFVLNLSGDVDRWVETARALESVGVSAERFAAIDGRRSAVEREWLEYNRRGLELEIERKIGRRLIASPGAWAYLYGLRDILNEAVRSRATSIVVLDDDVALHYHAADLLSQVLDELPDDWRLVYLGATQRDWTAARPYSTHLYRPGTHLDGSYAVAIHHSVFGLLLEEIEKFSAPFDSGPLASVTDLYPDDVYVAWPNVAIADVRSSSLRAPRSQSDFAAKARWRLGDYARDFSKEQAPIRRRGREDELVSIVVALDHASRWNWHGITSLRAQTHADFEIIIVPDMSLDHVAEHALALAATDSRITVVETDASLHRWDRLNIGLDVARGPLVSLQSLMELSSPTRLERLVAKSADLSSPVLARLGSGRPGKGWTGNYARGQRALLSLESGVVPRAIVREVGGFVAGTDGPAADAVSRYQRETRGVSQGLSAFAVADGVVARMPYSLTPPLDVRTAPADLGRREAGYDRGDAPLVLATLRLASRPAYRVIRPN